MGAQMISSATRCEPNNRLLMVTQTSNLGCSDRLAESIRVLKSCNDPRPHGLRKVAEFAGLEAGKLWCF